MLLWIPSLAMTWLAIGAAVAIPFLLLGVGRVVEGAARSSLAFRLLVFPAAALLWPVILHRWIEARRHEGRQA
ncbi:MAG: hypothetical protein R2708_05085 [Vicinamibacterales bacterium]